MAIRTFAQESTDDTARSRRASRIRILSRAMAILCLTAVLALVATMSFYWIATPSPAIFAQAGLAQIASYEIASGTRALGFLVSMVPLGVLVWGLIKAHRCFEALARGHFFSAQAIGGLHAFALGVLVSSLLKPFAGAALFLLLSWSTPSGVTALAFSVGSDTVLALIFAGTVAVIAWIMTEAIAIADENAQFV